MNMTTSCWLSTLKKIMDKGRSSSPRGLLTKEVIHHTFGPVSMRQPVIICQGRKLSYKFMAAEAYWILTGDDSVKGIAPWNRRMAEYSDDGDTLYGAYGPRFVDQLSHIVDKLVDDQDTRQACLTLWRPNPPKTKDVPCTVGIVFKRRKGFYSQRQFLDAHVFMRSSDAWLGLPYDVFTFSMMAHLVCCHVNKRTPPLDEVLPGRLYVTAVSSHLYEHDIDAAYRCVSDQSGHDTWPTWYELAQNPDLLLDTLKALRDAPPDDPLRWWTSFGGTPDV